MPWSLCLRATHLIQAFPEEQDWPCTGLPDTDTCLTYRKCTVLNNLAELMGNLERVAIYSHAVNIAFAAL